MDQVAKIVIEDEVNIHVKNVDLPVKRAMINTVSFFLPSARYSPAYKMGRWDGRTSFMTMGGKSYLNCLEQLLPVLQQHGYEFEIDDQRAYHKFDFDPVDTEFLSHMSWPHGHRFAGQPIELRDYQADAINTCLQNLQGVQVLPTSGGKTIITATLSMVVQPHGRTIVIVPNKNLVQQTEEDYRNLGLDVGVLYGDRKEYDCTHTICTWQSLNVLDKKHKDCLDADQMEKFLKNLTAVIVDECFDADSKVLTPSGYVRIADIMPGDKVINYSETTQEFKVDEVVKQHVNLTKSQAEKMYELEFDNGAKIKVTGNHKFLTTTGWCRADELTENHEILSH